MDRKGWIVREIRVDHGGNAAVALQALRAFGVALVDADELAKTAVAFHLEALTNPPPAAFLAEGLFLRNHVRGPYLQFSVSNITHTISVVCLERTAVRLWISVDAHALRTTAFTPYGWWNIITQDLQTILSACDAPNVLMRAFAEAVNQDGAENAFTEGAVTVYLE